MRVKETPMPFDEAIRQLASRLGHESLPIAAGNLERMLRQSEVKQSEVKQSEVKQSEVSNNPHLHETQRSMVGSEAVCRDCYDSMCGQGGLRCNDLE